MNVTLTSTTNELDMASASSDLCGYTVKLRALAGLAYQICIVNKRKHLVFCDWPVTQWNVELILTNLCFEVGSILAVHKAQDRKDIIHDFHEKGRKINFLVTSLRISATALDLQKDCCDMVFMDVPTNAQIALQGMCLGTGIREFKAFFRNEISINGILFPVRFRHFI